MTNDRFIFPTVIAGNDRGLAWHERTDLDAGVTQADIDLACTQVSQIYVRTLPAWRSWCKRMFAARDAVLSATSNEFSARADEQAKIEAQADEIYAGVRRRIAASPASQRALALVGRAMGSSQPGSNEVGKISGILATTPGSVGVMISRAALELPASAELWPVAMAQHHAWADEVRARRECSR